MKTKSRDTSTLISLLLGLFLMGFSFGLTGCGTFFALTDPGVVGKSEKAKPGKKSSKPKQKAPKPAQPVAEKKVEPAREGRFTRRYGARPSKKAPADASEKREKPVPEGTLALRPEPEPYLYPGEAFFVVPVLEEDHLLFGIKDSGLHLVSLESFSEVGRYPIEGEFCFYASGEYAAFYQPEDDAITVLSLPGFQMLKKMLSPLSDPIVSLTIGGKGGNRVGLLSRNSGSRNGRYGEIDLDILYATQFEGSLRAPYSMTDTEVPLDFAKHHLGPPIFYTPKFKSVVVYAVGDEVRSDELYGRATRSGLWFREYGMGSMTDIKTEIADVRFPIPSTEGNIYLAFDKGRATQYEAIWKGEIVHSLSRRTLCRIQMDWSRVQPNLREAEYKPSILFSPEKNRILVLVNKAMFRFRLDAEAVSEHLDEKELVVLASPWQKTPPGERLRFQYRTWSGSKVSQWELIFGPQKMRLSKSGLLVWTAPKQPTPGNPVLIRVRNKAGGETYFHSIL